MTASEKNNSSPIVIGLTGGIGSGKSTVAEVFKTLQIPVFNSDLEAKTLYCHPEIQSQIIALFGNVYFPNGQLNKQQLANIVFNDKKKLQQLNNIIHPAVAKKFDNWLKQHQKNSFVIKEAAILIESGAAKQVDKIIVVTAPKTERVQRVMQRDNVSQHEVEQRMQHQLTEEELLKHAHYVISNDGKSLIIPQILTLIEKLK
jgi:dephospho-CoA kinase